MITEQQAREALSWVDALAASQNWNRATHGKAQEYILTLVQVVNAQFIPTKGEPPAPPEPVKEVPNAVNT